MLDKAGTTISILPSRQYTFLAKVENRQTVETVDIVFEKNEEKTYIDTYYDKATGCYLASGYFNGVPGYQYFFTPVYWAAQKEITKGYDTIFFGTGMNCKREDMITFLWRAAGKPGYKKATSFTDVAKGKYYYNAIMWAAEKGITKGYSDGSFGVDREITREDTVTFIYRAAGSPAYKNTRSFSDLQKSKYYYKPIMWAAENGITNGYSSGPNAGKFGVGFNVLREDIVTFLYRAASKNLIK